VDVSANISRIWSAAEATAWILRARWKLADRLSGLPSIPGTNGVVVIIPPLIEIIRLVCRLPDGVLVCAERPANHPLAPH
jgi:hypothetical protein